MARTTQEIEKEQLDQFNSETEKLALARRRALLNAADDDNVDPSREAIIDKRVKERTEIGLRIDELLKQMQKVNGYDQYVSTMMEIIELCKANAEYLHTYDPLHNVVLLAINPLRWREAASAVAASGVIPAGIQDAYTNYRSKQLPANVAFDVQQAALEATTVDANGSVGFVTEAQLLEDQLLPGTETIPQGAKESVVKSAQQAIMAMQLGYFASQGYHVQNMSAQGQPPAYRVTNQSGNPMTQDQLNACKASFSDYISRKRLSMNIKQEPVTPDLQPPRPGR